MNSIPRARKQIGDQDGTDVSRNNMPHALERLAPPPVLAELAERTPRRPRRATRKASLATDEFRLMGRAIADAEEAATVRDGRDLAPAIAAINNAKTRRETAAAAIAALTKRISELEREVSELDGQLCRAAADFLNPMRIAAVARFRKAGAELKSARDAFVAIGLAIDADHAQLAHAMNVRVPDLENANDLLFTREMPRCPALAAVQRAIRAAGRVSGA
jgi:hypothetical protein